jgi:hypothetical protein
MTVHPLQRARRWYLGRNRLIVSGHAAFGERDQKYEYDGYWSGTRWVRGRQDAISFADEQAALAYIEGNYERMSDAKCGSTTRLA